MIPRPQSGGTEEVVSKGALDNFGGQPVAGAVATFEAFNILLHALSHVWTDLRRCSLNFLPLIPLPAFLAFLALPPFLHFLHFLLSLSFTSTLHFRHLPLHPSLPPLPFIPFPPFPSRTSPSVLLFPPLFQLPFIFL